MPRLRGCRTGGKQHRSTLADVVAKSTRGCRIQFSRIIQHNEGEVRQIIYGGLLQARGFDGKTRIWGGFHGGFVVKGISRTTVRIEEEHLTWIRTLHRKEKAIVLGQLIAGERRISPRCWPYGILMEGNSTSARPLAGTVTLFEATTFPSSISDTVFSACGVCQPDKTAVTRAGEPLYTRAGAVTLSTAQFGRLPLPTL